MKGRFLCAPTSLAPPSLQSFITTAVLSSLSGTRCTFISSCCTTLHGAGSCQVLRVEIHPPPRNHQPARQISPEDPKRETEDPGTSLNASSRPRPPGADRATCPSGFFRSEVDGNKCQCFAHPLHVIRCNGTMSWHHVSVGAELLLCDAGGEHWCDCDWCLHTQLWK